MHTSDERPVVCGADSRLRRGSDNIMSKDMTKGSPIRLMLFFAFPLLIGNLLQQTYSMIDAAIVGRYLGTQALASVGATSSVQFLVLGFCMGMCNGFSVPVARFFGAGDYARMRNCIAHAVTLTAGAAVLLTVACALLCPWILKILSITEDIYDNAYIYLIIIFLGMPFTLLYNLLSSILRAVGDSRTPFLFLAFSTVLNIGLDLLCILVFSWGCAGAAIATITAQAVSGIGCLIFISRRFKALVPTQRDRKLTRSGVGMMLGMGLPMGLQFSITAIGSMVMQSANNGLGSIYVSGFTAAARIKQFAMSPFDAIATSVSVFCSQNAGAKQAGRIRKGFVQGLFAGVFYGICAGLVLIFFGRTLSLIFVSPDAADVLDASAKYLRYMGYFYWSLGFLNVCRMCTQGLGFSGRAVISGVMEMIARIFVSFVFVGTYGFTAICCADQTAWMMACVYIVPMCLYCIRKVCRGIDTGPLSVSGNCEQ